MAENSKIEWTDHTFNPWIGCTKVSPACDNCYAEAMMDRRLGAVKWGGERKRTSAENWRKPLSWNKKAERAGRRDFVFCASLADVFDNQVPEQWRADLFGLIAQTPSLTWLLLTKRIGNVMGMVSALPRNVALGATMANQEEYDRDAPKLFETARQLRAAFTFGSFEPLLGPIELDGAAPDWIIVGGESGPKARPMRAEWVSEIGAAAAFLGRDFLFKQWGEFDASGRRVGKSVAGRIFAGQTWDNRPVAKITVEATPCPRSGS